MRRITFRVDETLIERARQVARAEGKTISAAFREWLAEYTASNSEVEKYDGLMQRLRGHVVAGRKFTRQEMNER